MTKSGAPVALGIEVSPDWSIGALFDANGEVVQRFEPCDSLAETLSAASAAQRRIAQVGVTSAEWESSFASAAIEEARRAFSAAAVAGPPLPSGVALALAEATCGVARGARHVIAFAIGDHPVAGLLFEGKVWRGAHSLAGTIGWLALNPVEREDYRRNGCLESEVGPAGIVRRLVWRVKSGDQSLVVDRVQGDFSRIGVEEVLAGARQGDGVAVSVLRDTIKYLGMAVANLVTVVDPDLVVLGGLIESDADLVLEPLRQDCTRRLHPTLASQVRIEVSALGIHGPAVGAAVHAAAASAT